MILRALLLSACAAAAAPVSFRAEIAPLLQRRCAACHSAENPKGHYQLDTFGQLLKAGQSDLPPVVPGKIAESEIAALLREKSAADRMPQKADPLPEEEIALIERWIAEGARFDGSSKSQPLVELARASMLRPAPAKYGAPLPIAALAFSPDGQHVVVGGYYEAIIWNVADGTLVRRISGLPERILSLAWHPQRPILAVGGGSPMQWGTVALADVKNAAPVRFLCDLPETVLSVAFSPDGKRIAAGSGDRTVRLFDAATGASLRVLKLHADWVQGVAFSEDGSHLITASRDRTARVVDLSSGEVNTSYTAHDMPLLAAAFSQGSKRAWTLARGGALHNWDARSVSSKNAAVGTDLVNLVRVGDSVVALASDRKLRLISGDDRKVKGTWDAPREMVQAFAVSPDGTRLACGTTSGTVAIYSLPEGKLIGSFPALPK